jgi:RNA polymerase-binding transcription factor DksA
MKQAGATARKKIAGSEFWKEAELRLREERTAVKAALASEQPSELAEQLDERLSPSEDEIREAEYAHRDSLQRRLREINDAVARLRGGTYGDCVVCGERIGLRRIAFDPAVALCLPCQQAQEGTAERSAL